MNHIFESGRSARPIRSPSREYCNNYAENITVGGTRITSGPQKMGVSALARTYIIVLCSFQLRGSYAASNIALKPTRFSKYNVYSLALTFIPDLTHKDT